MTDLKIQQQAEMFCSRYGEEAGFARVVWDACAKWMHERENKLIHKYTQEQIHRATLGLPMVSYQDWNSNLPSPPKTK